jgi:flagellar basal-body rod protein FlgG
MTTTGYKRRRPEFQDLLYQSQRRIGASSSSNGTVLPAGVQLGLGVKTAAVYRVHEQGDLVNTENRYDLAIQGDGFFVVDLPSGEQAYTRSGNFQLSPDGVMVTPDGYSLNPAITVPQNALEVSINQEGTVTAKLQGQVALQTLGQLQLATFVNPTGLEAIGSNLLLETDASGRHLPARPAATASARSSRASSKARTSIPCRS